MAKLFTRETLEKFKKELEHLKSVKRKEISDRIKHAVSFGDLKENFAYHEAKEAQGFLEGKIRELENIIRGAKIIENKNNGVVEIGSNVVIASGKEKDKYQIVEPEESDILNGKISSKSPLGKELLGKKAGDRIKIETPEGKKEYIIKEMD